MTNVLFMYFKLRLKTIAAMASTSRRSRDATRRPCDVASRAPRATQTPSPRPSTHVDAIYASRNVEIAPAHWTLGRVSACATWSDPSITTNSLAELPSAS